MHRLGHGFQSPQIPVSSGGNPYMIYTMQNRKMPSSRSVKVYFFTALALAFLSGLFPTALMFTMLAICFASVALLSIPRMTYPRILLILTVASIVVAGIVLLLTREPFACFAAISFAPATALLTLTIRKRYSRTCGIILAAIGMGLFYLACYALAIYFTYHRFSLDLFKELYASAQTEFLSIANEYINEAVIEQIGEIDEAMLIETFNLTMSILPSILIVILLGTVWLSTVLLRFIFKGYLYGLDRFADWRVTMNRPAALLFFLATVLFIIPFPKSVSYLPIIFLNILLILLPGFFIVGCSGLRARFFHPHRRPPMLMIFLLVLLALFMTPIFLVYFIALTGVTQVLFPKKQHQRPEEPPTPEDPA